MAKAKSEKKPKSERLWTTQEFGRLRHLAGLGLTVTEARKRIPNRTTLAVKSKAALEEIRFTPEKIHVIRAFGVKGGVGLREDFGGAVGVRWGCAHRSGGTFPTNLCEALMEEGVLVPEKHRRGSDATFVWHKED